MEIIQDDAKKLVQVWLSRKESGDEALQNIFCQSSRRFCQTIS